MAAMTMDREPEMARFIDTYKFDQDMSNKRDRFGGGTSLPLNSDGYEDKQRALREERHRDWMVQQDKPKDPAVYYRLGTPEQGFPGLGSYQKQRQENNKMRQKEYNSLLRKQKQTEQEKLMNRHRSPPRPAQPQGPQVDYNLQGEQARAEEKRAYQDYMGKYQYNANAPPKPTFDYEENKKILNEERKREYNQLMDKKAKEERYWQMRGRPVTPPGGLNIGAYDKQLKETAAAKKKEYKEMLDQQQKEHMYLRARQEPEMAVIDRNAPQQYLANKPPPGPGYRPREEAFKTEPRPIPERPQYGQPPYPGHGQYMPESDRLNPEAFDRPSYAQPPPPRSPGKQNPDWLKPQDDDRPVEGTPLAFKTNSYSQQAPPAPEQAFNGPPAFSNQGPRPGAENGMDAFYERPARMSGRPRSRRSTESEKKYVPTNMESMANISPRRMKNTLYEDSEEVSLKRREASKERQKDYNEYLRSKNEERRRMEEEKHYQQASKPAQVVKNQYYSSDDYEKFQKEIAKEQSKEYQEFLAKKAGQSRNREWNFEQNGVLELHGDEAVQSKRNTLRAERQKEYNSYISQRKKELRNPYDNYVYPTVAVAEKPIVAYMGSDVEQRKRYLREERKQEYERHKAQQKQKHPDRRNDYNGDVSGGPYSGLFQGLGDHGNKSDLLNQERKREYNENSEQYAGKEKMTGRPNWARETLPNNSDRGRSSPMKSQPPTDQYQQMLDEKRREEAGRRRYDDPEYQGRLAESRERERGEAGPRYGGY